MKSSVHLDIKRSAGFTLVELLIVVSLIAITAGISGDIILSLVRSFTKTQITNDIEQAGSFVISKMEKEMRSATSITGGGNCASSITFVKDNSTGGADTITYSLNNGSMFRSLNGGTSVALLDQNLANVRVENGNDIFCDIQDNPDVVRIRLVLEQASGAGVSVESKVVLEQTIVMRGTY